MKLNAKKTKKLPYQHITINHLRSVCKNETFLYGLGVRDSQPKNGIVSLKTGCMVALNFLQIVYNINKY